MIIYNNRFCLISKTKDISFNTVIKEELKPNFKSVDNVISDKHVKSFVMFYNPEKVQSPLTYIIVYDFETFYKGRAVPYCSSEMSDHVLSFKGEAEKVRKKRVEYNLFMVAHDGSGFDSYVVLNNLPQWPSVVKTINNGVGITSLKIFNGYVDENEKFPNMYILDVGEFILIGV